MTIPELSRLERVELREKFKTEAGDFTPWLADEANIALLGDTIGLDLEVEAQEKEVGPFRADILCKDTADDTWVLIENQLERTDHTHLGQLMTYASGLKAVTIIWIAQKFTEEHRAAIDWLNEITDSDFKFFGIEVELWKIGNSEVAPKFNIVSKPNEWSRAVARGQEGITGARQLQLRFWNAFKSYVEDQGSQIRTGKPSAQNWMNISLGKTGYQLLAVASMWDQESRSYSKNEIRAELYVYSEEAKLLLANLEETKETIEEELGYRLTWINTPEMKSARAFVRKTVVLGDEKDWSNQHAWLLENLVKFQKAFLPFISG